MKTFPLQSLTIIEAQQKQFALVDSICRHFPGSEFLTGGDLGLTPGLNQPRVTQRVEQVLADAFHAQAAALVQGAGTGAIRAGLAALLNGGAVPEVKSAVIANAQSKVLIVEFHQPIAARVLEEAQKRGALPYPVGAESKYEIPPLFYRLSGTFRQANPQLEHCAIRINPNRSGEETVLRILRESIASI